MIRCECCFEQYEDEVAKGVCPYCGYYHGFVPDDPRYLPIGTIVNSRYAVGGVIGDGGFGITYRAWDTKLKVCIALKEYYQRGVVNRIPNTTDVFIAAPDRAEEFYYGKDRLLHEAQIVSKFQSDSIVRVNDFFEENGTSYMVMELLDYPTLAESMVSQNHPFDANEVKSIAEQLCSALIEIHEANVLHRDIAPDNIFISPEGKIKIIDFGSARLSKEDVVERLILVKEGFSPIEQYEIIDLKQDLQGDWTDIYAVGATLYYCLTGVRPAESRIRKNNVDEKQPDIKEPCELNPNVPEDLNNIIMKAMAINSHERFKTASEMLKALQGEVKVLPLPVVRRRKRMVRAVSIGGALLLAACVAIFAGWNGQKNYDQIVLQPAEITVWYRISEDDTTGEKEAALKKIIEEEQNSDQFERVTINLVGIEESRYETELEKAYNAGEMPTLFECYSPEADYMDGVYDSSKIVENLDSDSRDCWFVRDYTSEFSSLGCVPLGIDVPVIYINTVAVSDYTEGTEITCMADLLNLSNGEMIYKPIAIDAEAGALFSEMFEDYDTSIPLLDIVDEEEFLNSGAAVFLSTTKEMNTVCNTLDVAVVPVDADRILCRFDDFWSISNCGEDEQAAAEVLLAYFYTNYAQEYYYLEISDVCALPLNKSIVEEYDSVQWRFSEIMADYDKYYFY
jgi:hypothetical protein